jgi:ABC-type multidrug transport system ATPase subunit
MAAETDGGDRKGEEAARLVERARDYVREGKPIDASKEVERIATELGDDDGRGRALVALTRSKRNQDEYRTGTRSRADFNAEDASIVVLLDGLIGELQRAAQRRREAPVARAGARPDRASSPETARDGAAMVVCERVGKRYAGFALGPVSFTLAHGEILGVVGANGTGKTSLLRIIAGELAPDGGSCAVSSRTAGDRELPVPVVIVSESPPPWSGRLEEYLSWQAAVFGHRTPEGNARRVGHVLTQLDLVDDRSKLWRQLPDGMRMRAAIAAALLANPGLIVLDEPLGPLDPLSQQELLRWVRVHAGGAQRTSFVIAAHHVTELEAVADQVVSLVRDRESFAVRPPRAAGGAATHIRLVLHPGADRGALLASLSELGEAVTSVQMPSYVLVRVEPQMDLGLESLAARVEGLGVSSVQDLSRSNLRPLLWEEPS